MVRAIVHVGAHKTGTSFLQEHLHANSSLLLENGVYYPELEGTPYPHQHSSLAIALRAADKRPALHTLRSLREAASARSAHTLLLSGEAFFFAAPEEMAALAEGLAGQTGAVRILMYIRNTYDYVRSQLNQHLRFGDYLVTEGDFVARLRAYQPDDVIRRWEAAFGPAHVDVFSYDQHKPNLLDHFAEATRLPRLHACPVPAAASNPSIDFHCASLVNQLLFDKGPAVKAAVYSALVDQGARAADHVYPLEAALIERVLDGARIATGHPKLAALPGNLTARPTWPSSGGHELASIRRLAATLEVIRSVLDGQAPATAGP